MATLSINDLPANKRHDRQAMKALRGGMSFGWIRPYQSAGSSTPFSMIIGKLQVYNYRLINPIFQTVNQTNLVDIDITETVESLVQVSVGQENLGSNGGLPLPI